MTEYDYIVVGAGSAGCVLANRLTADPWRRVLLLEAGGSDRSLWIQVPIGYARTFHDPRYNWMYEAQPDPMLDDRRAFWPRGKVLGGSSSINAMVYVRGRPSREVTLQAQATKVLFAGSRAVGVEYLEGGARRQANARSEVLLAAGAVNSPQLLELSGVGDGALLRQFNIPVIADSPAVGRALQDHLAVSYFFRSRVPTLNDQLAPFLGKVRAALRYALGRRGPLAMSVNQAGAFLPSRSELTRPNLHIYFNPASYSTTTEGPRRRLMNPDPYPGFLMSYNTCRPMSRGSIHLRSSDPLMSPAIVPNSLATDADVRDVYDGARVVRRIAAAAPLAEVTESEREPGPRVQSDGDVLADFRRRAGTVFHPCGTCAMGADPRTSVVDPRLRVHGVTGLRVVDASIFPNITSGNLNCPTIMVAEKAADLILEDSPAPVA